MVDAADLGSVEFFSYEFKSRRQQGTQLQLVRAVTLQVIGCWFKSDCFHIVFLNMKSKVSNDRYLRVFFSKEIQLMLYRYIRFPEKIKNNCIFQKKVFISQIRNRCIFSSKSRSVFSKFRSSRIFFRQYILAGKINCVKKQSWLQLTLVVKRQTQ